MITLHVFGSAFGLPDPSPFVVKADILLQMSGLAFGKVEGNLRKAPKGKLPIIDDDGVIVPDSTFIRLHLERKHGIDFDKGLSAAERGVAWSIEKMLDDHFYWLIVMERWMNPENFERGPRTFFNKIPAPLRPMIIAMIHRQVRKGLHAHGLGRHTDAECAELSTRCVEGLAAVIGDKPWLMGSEPCGADATVFAFVQSGLCPLFASHVRTCMVQHANLVAYKERGEARWFPDRADA
jgi:glutathione S-transferase